MKMDRIKAALAAIIAEDNFSTMTTDKGVIKWEGEENLKEGDTVVIVAEDGTEKSAEDGEYVTDEVKITVENGSVKTIEEIKKDEEETPAEETTSEDTATDDAFAAKKAAFAAKKAAFEMSYDEKTRKIMDAIVAAGYKDAWVVSAGDDFAVIENFIAEGYEYLRFDIEWEGEDVKVVGEPIKVRNAFIPEDIKDEDLFEAETSGETEEEKTEESGETEKGDELEERLKAIEDRLDKIEEALKNVTAEPVEEQYENANAKETATSRKEARLNAIFGCR